MHDDDPLTDNDEPLYQPRLWRDKGWTAQVIKNEDDEGWAVAMTKLGEAEPALVGPMVQGPTSAGSASPTLVMATAQPSSSSFLITHAVHSPSRHRRGS